MSGGRWSFAHRQKAPQKTSLVGWLRGESVMSGVDIRLRFWLECSRWKAESDGADICAVRPNDPKVIQFPGPGPGKN